MASLANSDDEENLALALSLSQLSSDDLNEQIARPSPEGLAPANRMRTPISDEKDDLALALRLSLLSPVDYEEQIAQLHHTGSASAGEGARSSTPSNESDEDDFELALNMSQPADIFDEQSSEFNRQREPHLASLPMTMPLEDVRMPPPLQCKKLIKDCARMASRMAWPPVRAPTSLDRPCMTIISKL